MPQKKHERNGFCMKIINLTPHEIAVVAESGEVIRRYPASGTIARAASKTEIIDELDGIPVASQQFGEVSGLPDPEPGTVYLVSLVVGQAMKGQRDDLYGPDTSPDGAVRDAEGRIIGTRRLVKY